MNINANYKNNLVNSIMLFLVGDSGCTYLCHEPNADLRDKDANGVSAEWVRENVIKTGMRVVVESINQMAYMNVITWGFIEGSNAMFAVTIDENEDWVTCVTKEHVPSNPE